MVQKSFCLSFVHHPLPNLTKNDVSFPSVSRNLQKKDSNRTTGSLGIIPKILIFHFNSLIFRRTLALTYSEFMCHFSLLLFLYRVLDFHLNSFISPLGFFLCPLLGSSFSVTPIFLSTFILFRSTFVYLFIFPVCNTFVHDTHTTQTH